MVITHQEFITSIKQDIDRWKRDLAKVDNEAFADQAALIRAWIVAGEKLIEPPKAS